MCNVKAAPSHHLAVRNPEAVSPKRLSSVADTTPTHADSPDTTQQRCPTLPPHLRVVKCDPAVPPLVRQVVFYKDLERRLQLSE